ncbi:MAG TPA: RcnB family protein [Steroidobacteraceae bacterium]|jgi:Ni/Co efflux regulator RcnB|nr:RcnB family protein [Steroidobacteraceae bacterium]
MKRAAIGVLLVSLFAGSVAMAGQGYRPTPDRRDPPRELASNHRDARHDWDRDHRGHDYRPAPKAHYVYRPAPARVVVYRPAPPHRWVAYSPPPGYYVHTWRRGERLPVAYYAPRYVIADYHECGLRAPPVGYHWVRVNNDAVLAAVATGVVLDVALHLFG